MLSESRRWTEVLKEQVKNLSINMFVRKAGICRWPVFAVNTDITSLNSWNFKPGNFIPEIQ